MLVPFLNLLFGTEALVTEKPEFALNADALLNTLNYQISQIIIEKGQVGSFNFYLYTADYGIPNEKPGPFLCYVLYG